MLKHAAVKPPSANLNEPPLLWVLWSRHNRLSFICVDFSSFFLVKNVESMSDAQRWATARGQLLPNLLPFKSRARRPAQSDAAPHAFAYSWQSRDLVSSAYVQWFSRGVTGSRQLMTLIWWMQNFRKWRQPKTADGSTTAAPHKLYSGIDYNYQFPTWFLFLASNWLPPLTLPSASKGRNRRRLRDEFVFEK